jgi:hypothetical protein
LICVDTAQVNTVLQRSISPERRDVVIVVVNDPEYGGSGGAVAVASTNTLVVELVLHELGHSFGLLADEYDTDPELCESSLEPAEPNVTKEIDRSSIKWNVGGGPPNGWIDLATPIPTANTSPGIVGVYEGARYCTDGMFRPTFDSKMRTLERPYEQVNTEQLVRRIYNWVSPVDSSEPLASMVTLSSGDSQEFKVQIPRPATSALDVTWRVDGQIAATGPQFIYSSAGLPSASQIVEVTVEDLTPWVRDDPASVLIEARTWTVVTQNSPLGPDTIIDSKPALFSKSPNSVFTFSSTEVGSTFACSLDSGPFMACKNPKRYSRLVNGTHTFQVKASDAHGITDSTPATYTWTVDRARPDTTITANPPARTKITDASFEFVSTEGNAGFQCKLNRNAFAVCASPHRVLGLGGGKHTFQVVAIDAAGNTDRKAAVYQWVIDTTPPETKIRSKPPLKTNLTSAKFSFSGSERGSTFECSLNVSPFSACLSPQLYALAPGSHIFHVRATDPAGNTDPTPASYSWTIE